MDKTKETLESWINAANVNFINDEAKEAYRKRAKRIVDVIELKIPDRVPVAPSFGMFPALDNGYTCEEVMFDLDKAHKAWMKTLNDFQPDIFRASSYAYPGRVVEILDYKLLKVPGRGIPANHGIQFVEGEYVKAEEFYDAFINDPADFIMRTYLSRVCGALEPLKTIGSFNSWFGYLLGFPAGLAGFANPEVAKALEAIQKAGQEIGRWMVHGAKESMEIASLGFPDIVGGHSAAPFDIIGDYFRGTHGIMTDIYKNPGKLLKAMERLVPIVTDMGVNASKRMGKPVVMLMLHKGLDSFMSNEQFKTFYWPSLKKVLDGIIDTGLIPMPMFEGKYTSRLEIIKDIPRGKAIYYFEDVDLHKAKEILGDIVCFRGNVPGSLLYGGTVQEIKDYVKKLIDVVGKGGGLIVDSGIWFDEAKHENVKAVVDFTKEYGVYR